MIKTTNAAHGKLPLALKCQSKALNDDSVESFLSLENACIYFSSLVVTNACHRKFSKPLSNRRHELGSIFIVKRSNCRLFVNRAWKFLFNHERESREAHY